MKLLINQPGRTGDILICLPIARWYSSFYEVHWLCPKEYHDLFRNIEYVIPVEGYQEKDYEIILDLSFGIQQGTTLHKWWTHTRPTWQSFVSAKYALANVPIRQRWNFEWIRNEDRERNLYERIINKYGTEYAVVHETTWDYHTNISVSISKVTFERIADFNIFDWYAVLDKATEMHCIDSSLCNFVDVVPEFHLRKKFYYSSPKTPSQEDRTILMNNWRFV